MMTSKYPMTTAGRENLLQELKNLKTGARPKALHRIKDARKFCDFREDSEYEAAMENQAAIEQRIKLLEEMTRNAIIIENNAHHSDHVILGSSVTFVELPDGEEETYTIVGHVEADLENGTISNESPLGKALLGHHLNDQVTIDTPGGEINVTISAIQ